MRNELYGNVIALNIYFSDDDKDTIIINRYDLEKAQEIIEEASYTWHNTENPEETLDAESSYDYLYQCLDKEGIDYTDSSCNISF